MDSGANPDAKVSLVKMVAGRPTATEVLEEERMNEGHVLAGACAAVAETLKSGLRPLPSEVQRLLDAASAFSTEGALRCDAISPRDWSTLGPQIAKGLVVVADAARLATEADQLAKIATVAEGLMRQLLTAKDLSSARFSKAAVASRTSIVKGSQRLFTNAELEEKYELLSAARENWTGSCCNAGKSCRHYKELEQALFTVIHLRKVASGTPTAGQLRRR